MESVFTASTFRPEFVFSNLRGSIIDYVISSYTINMHLIKMYYWHPALQIHCSLVYNDIPDDRKYITLHKLQEPGIYHAKFVIVTTTEMLRLIIMTTNVTNQLVENCWNDYYIANLPLASTCSSTQNTALLTEFLKANKITLKKSLSCYRWNNLKARFLVSCPGLLSHAMCWKWYYSTPFDTVVIQTTTAMTNFDVRPIFDSRKCVFRAPKNFEKRKESDMSFFLLDLTNKSHIYSIDTSYDGIPYHFKRYILSNANSSVFVLTSANLSKQAWGSRNDTSANAEIGLIWEFSSDYVPQLLATTKT